MKIPVLSCLYPYRGGISQFGERMLSELGKEHEVRAFNFKRQYPSFLFPGKTQYVSPGDKAPAFLSERLLDSINPFSWSRTARAITEWGPDLVLVNWWMSFFGPSMGRVAGILTKKGIKVVGVLHNVVPHEPHFYDKPLTRYFLVACSGHVTLSNEVTRSLESFGEFRIAQLFHPVYNHFGEPLPRQEAEKALGLEPGKKNLLFFGLIRKYKGLDILLKAFEQLPEDYQLIVAGEPYGSFDEYQAIIDASPAKSRIHCFTEYIEDARVKTFFSCADLSVLPYRSATQSGVRAVSYNFGVPMVVTDTGSLKADIGDTGTGLVAEKAEPALISTEILRFFETPGLQQSCRDNIKKELDRLSWQSFCNRLLEFCDTL